MGYLAGVMVFISALPLWHWLLLRIGMHQRFQIRVLAVDVFLFAGFGAANFYLRSKAERLFLLSAFISLLLSYGHEWIMGAVVQMIALIIGLMFAQWLNGRAKGWLTKQRLYDLIALAALINAAWAVVQFMNTDFVLSPTEASGGKRFITGFFDNPDFLGVLIGVALPVFFVKRRFWFLPLPLFALWFSASAFGFFSAGIALIFYLWRRFYNWRIAASVACGFAVALGIFLGLHGKVNESKLFRFRALAVSVPIALQRPVFGWGNGSFADVFEMKAPQIRDVAKECRIAGKDGNLRCLEHLHNEYGQVLFEQGFFGFGALIAILYLIGRKIRAARGEDNLIAASGMIAVAITALGFYSLRVPLIGIVALIYFSILKSQEVF